MKYVDQVFEQRDVLLDGNEFIRCTFNRCRIVFRGTGSVVLGEPTFNDCGWYFNDAAGNTVAFLAMLYSWGPAGRMIVEEAFARTKGPGSIPIH